MLKLTIITFLAILLNSRCAPPDPTPSSVIPQTQPVSLTASVAGPAILEVEVEGIGKATINDRTILVKVPAGYTKSTIRLTYKLTPDVKKVTPASGETIPIRASQLPSICIKNDSLGNCTLTYQLIIQSVSSLGAVFDPTSRQLDITRYYQPYALTFQLSNLNAQPDVTRRFQVRLVNKATGYSYMGENYMVNDKTGNVVFVNQPNATLPAEGQLRMTGTLPADMVSGEYAVSILVPTCYSPGANGNCLLTGIEGIDLTEPFVLRPGPALVGETSPTPTTANELVIKGRNFSVAQPIPVAFTNDFSQSANITASPQTETVARVTVPMALSAGQYRLDVSPIGGQAYSALFTVSGGPAKPSFAYVATLGSYVATQNILPALPAFKGGETLEVRYTGIDAQSIKAARLIDVKDAMHTIALTSNGSFKPYAGVPDFIMWKWTLPTAVPKGTYALAFEATDGTVSFPYYQAIRVE